MSTGLFSNRSGSGATIYRAQLRRQGDRTVAAFAEALAEGAPSITAASYQVGVSQQRGSQLFARIRRELGWQAK
jgi:hypothetical protein